MGVVGTKVCCYANSSSTKDEFQLGGTIESNILCKDSVLEENDQNDMEAIL